MSDTAAQSPADAGRADATAGGPPTRQTVPRALWRWGGMFIAPRRHVAQLDMDEGQRDGLTLGLLYLLGTSVLPMTESVATVLATHSIVALLSGVGRVVLTPIVVIVLAETLLGSKRGYRGGICLLPLVVVGTLARMLAQLGSPIGGHPLLPDLVGGVLVAALALWIRSAVPPEAADTKEAA
ncbi:MAG: hypothetical protein AAGA54_13870 [Myxococcota bacterium]